MWRKGAGAIAGFGVGALEKNGTLAQMPTFPGVPRIATIAIVANLAGFFAPRGKIRTVLDGVGESTTNIAAYKWGKGEDIAGAHEADVGDVEGRRRRVSREVSDMRQRVAELEAQLRSGVASDGAGAPSPVPPAFADYIDVPLAA